MEKFRGGKELKRRKREEEIKSEIAFMIEVEYYYGFRLG